MRKLKYGDVVTWVKNPELGTGRVKGFTNRVSNAEELAVHFPEFNYQGDSVDDTDKECVHLILEEELAYATPYDSDTGKQQGQPHHTPWCPGCPDIPDPREDRVRLCVQDPGWVMRLVIDMGNASRSGVWTRPGYLNGPEKGEEKRV